MGFSAAIPDDKAVPASKVLGEIEAGVPVEYDGYIIAGDLDLDQLADLPSVNAELLYQAPRMNLSEKKRSIASPIRITNCTIKGWANFNNTMFSKPVNLRNTRFEGRAGFMGAIFKDGADLSSTQFCKYADFLGSKFGDYAFFNESQFRDYADFEGAYFDYANFSSSFANIADFKFSHFNGEAYFGDAAFNGTADFRDAAFNGYAGFGGAAFNGYAYFGGAAFNGYAEFWYAAFNGTANFRGAAFNGYAIFWDAAFNGTASFWDAAFNGGASFGAAAFNGYAYFQDAAFNGTADFWDAAFNGTTSFMNTTFNISYFSAAQFNKEVSFENARFAGKTSLVGSRFKEDALFENASFQDELSLTRARYNKLFIRWHNITRLAYDDAAYMSLMKNFKDLGYYEDYDSCYFDYRKAHRGQPWPGVGGWEEPTRKFIDYPLELFYGYGTKPFNAFFFSLGIILAFAFFWWALGLGGPKDKTLASLQPGEEWLDGDLTDILGFSVTVFLSGTRFFIDPPALPRIEGRSRSMIKKAFILERLLGALFSILFFIAISGTIVRAS